MNIMHRLRPIVAILLVLCVVGISGVAAVQSVLHESQHSHHQAATHGSTFCSWMCAAGQTHDASVVPLAHTSEVLATFQQASVQYLHDALPSLRTIRAPPISAS